MSLLINHCILYSEDKQYPFRFIKNLDSWTDTSITIEKIFVDITNSMCSF